MLLTKIREWFTQLVGACCRVSLNPFLWRIRRRHVADPWPPRDSLCLPYILQLAHSGLQFFKIPSANAQVCRTCYVISVSKDSFPEFGWTWTFLLLVCLNRANNSKISLCATPKLINMEDFWKVILSSEFFYFMAGTLQDIQIIRASIQICVA
jgi:hypothetical protein